MFVLRRHLHLIWAIAVLLVGGTQMQHVYADACCHGEHTNAPQEQEHTDDTDCPVEHACCHAHVPVFFANSNDSGSLFLTASVRPLPTRDQRPVQGPSREIDYPPQLS